MSEVLQFDAMSTESLWTLCEDVRKNLTVKMIHRQRDIERRLRDLHRANVPPIVSPIEKRQVVVTATMRRLYPKVMPNYRKPAEPSQTWSGRANKPRCLLAQIANGKTAGAVPGSPQGGPCAQKNSQARRYFKVPRQAGSEVCCATGAS